MRIRMTRTEVQRAPDGRMRRYRAGETYSAPGEVDRAVARAWLDSGLAERVKSKQKKSTKQTKQTKAESGADTDASEKE